MIQNPMDVLTIHPVRKSAKQKQAFRDDIQAYAESLGYECSFEKGYLGSRNVVIGDPEKAEYLVTAHYDTCARLPFPNLITPCHFLPFIAYQLLVVILIFAAAGLAGCCIYLLTKIYFPAYWGAYFFLIAFLVLMMVGPANRHNANDNTSGVVTLLEIAGSIPTMSRHRVCFVLFDLEEAGLIGSSAYRKRHKTATERQIVLNLDCVGDGNQIMFFPTKKFRRDENKLNRLRSICGRYGRKAVSVREKGFAIYPSDQTNFPYGVGIAALNRAKGGILYCGRIHTHKDTILEITNVNILRAALITMICSPAAE